jgi:hypothetical protein
MEFVCSDPDAVVRGANVKATLGAFQLAPARGREMLERHHLAVDALRPDAFVPLQPWLDALRDIQRDAGPTKVRLVGSFAVENAYIPAVFADPEALVMAVDDLHKKNHRGDVGGYTVARRPDGALEVRCETPYPRMFEWGLIGGLCNNQRFRPGGRFEVEFIEAPAGAAHSCTIVVRRAGAVHAAPQRPPGL